jgi:type IX secretion system PorP/SprF family membrane protein
MKITLIILLCSCSYCVQLMAQQKVQFSQYMFSGVVINPAYAGADEALSLTFINRSQWTGVPNAPTTQTLSGHTLAKKKHLGLGLNIIHDKIGVHKNLNVLSQYAYHLQTGRRSYLSMGLQAGFHNRRSDYASLAGASADPRIPNASYSNTFFDFGFGLYFRSPRFHLGVSAPELVPENINVNDTINITLSRANVFIFSKVRLSLSDNLDLEPSVLVKHFSNVPISFDANVNMIFRQVLTFGLSYRKDESIDALLKLKITPQMQIGYAYDHTIGEVANISSGSHEIMVNYVFKFVRSNVSSPR